MTERSVAVLVLGAHRSGTSALTRMLNLLGCALPGDVLGENESNPTGHWEGLRAIEINEALLHALGRQWDDVRAMPVDWLASPGARVARERIREFVLADFSATPLWVLKDPRLCLLAPLWMEVLDALDIAVRVIVPIRDPREVAASLFQRDGIAPATSHLLWLRQVAAAEAASVARMRVLVHFDRLLGDWTGQADRIARQLAIAWPQAPELSRAAVEMFLQPELRHTVAPATSSETPLPAALAELWDNLSIADDDSRWPIIAHMRIELERGASLFEPAIANLAWCFGQSDRHTATLETVQQHAELLKARVAVLEASQRQSHEAIAEFERTVAHRDRVLAERDARIAAMENDRENDRARLASLARKLVEVEQALTAKDSEIDALTRSLLQVEETCRVMVESRSWRLTGPLRAMNAAIRNRSQRAARRPPEKVAEASMPFDARFYLQEYPDVRASGRDPYEHYLEVGKEEGRLPARPAAMHLEESPTFDKSREVVLIVTHDASRTGAPVLSLNISEAMRSRYNVIVLPLAGGRLMAAFRRHATLVVEPDLFRADAGHVQAVICNLHLRHPFKFAIVNSIESRGALPTLAGLGVPSVCLIHEFAAYTRPRAAFPDAVWWATRSVFSTALTRDSAVSEFPGFANAAFAVVPQGRCTLTTEPMDEESSRVEDAWLLSRLRPERLRDDAVVVIGAGLVQQRKGVDLFIQCAARVIKAEGGDKFRFAWIGKGYDPENDLTYSAYLADQIKRSGIEDKVIFIGETSRIETAYEAADILLVTSRLDPLPNVAIDAMAHGLPVLCFQGTTGLADVLADAGVSEDCVCAYLDTAGMAGKILRLVGSGQAHRETGARMQAYVADHFSMQDYVDRIEALALDGARQVAAEAESARTIIASGLARPDYFSVTPRKGAMLDDAIRCEYIRPAAAGVSHRKLFPGFHPGIYRERHGIAEPGDDPLADYLRAGRPDGLWCQQVINPDHASPRIPDSVRVALHLHAYYLDLLPAILERLQVNAMRPDLFVSVADADGVVEVQGMLKRYAGKIVEVASVPNRGRDIGPLLTTFASRLAEGYDFVGHIHTKKTVDLKDPTIGQRWFEFLLENLLGGKSRMADIIVGRLAADPTIGMVFPDDPNILGWGENLPFARRLGTTMGLPDFPTHFVFPVGTMFWARADALRPLFDLRLDWKDYPAEPLPYDGSILHAIERLLPFVVEVQAKRCVVTHVPGVTR